ncbi:MAG: DUF6503 family protein [Bacteroidota bacterium]
MKNSILALLIIFTIASCTTEKAPQEQIENSAPVNSAAQDIANETNQGKKLVLEMIEAIGGKNGLYKAKDVEYTYSYVDPEGLKDVSTERYIFDGEYSWAKFTTHDKFVSPGVDAEVIQGYDGSESWVTVGGQLSEEEQVLGLSDFLRKTNYYWFAMMFKLADPGLNYEYKGTRSVDSINYEIVEVTFGENIGDAQDTYVLYINPETKLVDQFLFTVMGFGIKDPLLMKVKHEEIDGLKLTTYRKYAPANWNGEVIAEQWTEEISENVKFNNGFEATAFAKPTVK